MSDIDIAYGAARRSEYLNRKFAQVIGPGPKSGFNVRKRTGFTVRISQVDEPGEQQALVTPEGVVIHEADDWYADVLVSSSGGTYKVVCRYTHGPDAAAPTYLAVEESTVQSTDTVLATCVVLGGEISLLTANIKEEIRQRNRGSLWPTAAVKDERRPVVGQLPLPCSIMQNFDPASFLAGFSYELPPAAVTAFQTEVCVPPGCTAVSPNAFVRFWFSLQSFVADGSFTGRVDWLIPPDTEGAGPTNNHEDFVKVISGGAGGYWYYLDVAIGEGYLIPGKPLRVGILRNASDDLNATIRLEMIEFLYQRSCVGTLYEDLV